VEKQKAVVEMQKATLRKAVAAVEEAKQAQTALAAKLHRLTADSSQRLDTALVRDLE
jgi:hypothetical protein